MNSSLKKGSVVQKAITTFKYEFTCTSYFEDVMPQGKFTKKWTMNESYFLFIFTNFTLPMWEWYWSVNVYDGFNSLSSCVSTFTLGLNVPSSFKMS